MAFVEHKITAEQISDTYLVPKDVVIDMMLKGIIAYIFDKTNNEYYTYNYFLEEFINKYKYLK